jgi:trimeric autotransporter adhesin
MKRRIACVLVAFLSLIFSVAPLTLAQTSAQTASALPRLVRFGGTVKDLNGSPLTGVVGVTFALYSEKTGGAPLWLETQNATADSSGHYTVLLGSTKPEGLPAELFTSEQARWVGVQVSGQAEQARVLLVSAPYALKAGDAETIGGLPPSAFVLAAPAISGLPASSATAGTVTALAATDVTTTGGTVGYLPIFNGADTLVDSIVFQSAASPFRIGLNTAAPVTTLDVNGAGTIRGTLALPATGVATATAGKNSQGVNLTASSFNSTSSTAVNQVFRLQAEPASNDTTTPLGTLNLLYGLGTAAPAETGLKISSKGLLTFATGQTFPGTGAGTITGITTAAGSGLAGGGVKGTLTLSVPAAGITNAMLAHPSLTVTPGTGLSGGGLVALGNSITLNVNTTKIPQLGTANTFVGNQTVTGTVAATSFSGNGAGITNVNASNSAELGGLASSAYAQLAAANTFTGSQTVNGTVGATSTGSAFIGTSTSTVFAAVAGGGAGVGVFGNASGASGSGVYGSGATGVVGVSTLGGGPGGNFTGYTAPQSSDLSGTDGIDSTGGDGDPAHVSDTGGVGIAGQGGYGGDVDAVGGRFTGGNFIGKDGDGVLGNAGSGYAGNFRGDLNVTGSITAGTKDFKIDHPLDPANKYLVHASVESSEMKNIYDGTVTTDGQGQATVQLPEWFEVLNTDFRYQLTVIGQFAQAIVAHEIESSRFEIRTSAPNVKVSWQVTGVRQDAYAKANPLVVEQEKDARLRGFYIHPELYGAPAEKQIEWARHPRMMKRIQETQARQLAAAQKAAGPEPSSPRK